MSEEHYLTRKEVCDLLRISPATLDRMAKAGTLVPMKIGRRSIYARSVIDVYMSMQQVAALTQSSRSASQS